MKQIQLGPRQMTLELEAWTTKNMNRVYSFIENANQRFGPVSLNQLVSEETLIEDMGVLEILQIAFWLAEELKIHFFTEDLPLPPREIKKILMAHPAETVLMMINKTVDTLRFQRALHTSRSFIPTMPEQPSQYRFSRILVTEFKNWQQKVTMYREWAEQPFFPGRKQIQSSQALLDRLLERQDSHSLILNYLKYQSRLPKLLKSMAVLHKFHDHELSFWQIFVDKMQAFGSNLDQIRKDQKIFAFYNRLLEIIHASSPYSFINEAKTLLPQVEAFHQDIELKKLEDTRAKAVERMEKMIQKLLLVFDTFESDEEYRNQCLFSLRQMKKMIENTPRQEKIQELLTEAKDVFVDVIEEI